jgi:predicted O-linked N-acetylglucosamine transferase (SPINDLY family)
MTKNIITNNLDKARNLILNNSFSLANNLLDEILTSNPENPEALFLKAFIENNSNNLSGAEQYLVKALKTNPNHIASLNELALTYAKQELYDKAISYFEKLVSLDPGYISYSNLADVYAKSKKEDDAILAYEKALKYNQNDPFIYGPLGFLYYKNMNYQKALENFSQAIKLNPSQKDVNLFLGEIHTKFSHTVKAINFYKKEISIYPKSSSAHLQLGSALQKLGFIEEALIHFKEGIKILKEENSTSLNSQYSFLLYLLNHAPSSSMQEMLEVSKAFYRDCFPEFANSNDPIILYKHTREDFNQNKKIKIGYISKYLFSSTGERWILDLIEKHDKNKFEIYIYHDNSQEDDTTKNFAKFASKFRIVNHLDHLALAKLISDDGIDIMVDLLGHVAGNRLPSFVYKPAPIQVSWFGYFGTTGLPQMDYVFADAQVVKESETKDFVEKVYHLPNSYCYFRAPEISCEIENPPVLKNGYITFGCFSRFNKVNDKNLDLWSRILLAIPDSKLLLKHEVLNDLDFVNYLKQFFTNKKIEIDRLIFEPGENFDKYFEAYNRIDIGLDTFPYGGGTTTMHAMLMGVPCVSLEGDRWVSRGGGPLYYRLIGHPELIAQDENEYINKAVELSSDHNRLVLYRKELPQKFLSSPVCNPYSYTHDLEKGFLTIWEEKCKNIN